MSVSDGTITARGFAIALDVETMRGLVDGVGSAAEGVQFALDMASCERTKEVLRRALAATRETERELAAELHRLRTLDNGGILAEIHSELVRSAVR